MNENARRHARTALLVLLGVGTFWVLSPFLVALLFAAILCLTTWPLFAWLEARLKGRTALAALLATLLLALAVLLPMSYLAATVADGVGSLIAFLRPWFEAGDYAPPPWLAGLPLVGEALDDYWRMLTANREELAELGKQLFEPTRRFLLAAAGLIGQGLLELVLVVFITFFFYRDGRRIARRLGHLADKLGGEFGGRMLALARTTVMGVMIGIVGTAATQGTVALIGFLIAGVPAPLLLAAATFFLSMIPAGPPLIWGGAAWWLFDSGETGWAIFMLVYGMTVISSVDNFIRPILISRTASLPILMIALGVFGGVLSFGFVGIFLGPVILALALLLMERWSEPGAPEAPAAPEAPEAPGDQAK